jgi:hypothetical protein
MPFNRKELNEHTVISSADSYCVTDSDTTSFYACCVRPNRDKTKFCKYRYNFWGNSLLIERPYVVQVQSVVRVL